mgnify:CR=1 FL=1
MSKKTKKLRFISLFWDYVSALSLILLLMLFWKLGKGPIEVNFLRPYIIQALTNDTSSYDLNVKSVNLELVHSVQPIKIIAKDVSFKDKNDNYDINAPRLALSFSTRALLKGLLAPSSINIENPKIKITTFYNIKKDTSFSAIKFAIGILLFAIISFVYGYISGHFALGNVSFLYSIFDLPALIILFLYVIPLIAISGNLKVLLISISVIFSKNKINITQKNLYLNAIKTTTTLNWFAAFCFTLCGWIAMLCFLEDKTYEEAKQLFEEGPKQFLRQIYKQNERKI